MILNIRIDHKTADIQTMEKGVSYLNDLFQYLDSNYTISEFIPIQTCNRTEYYFKLNDYNDSNLIFKQINDKLKEYNALIAEKDDDALLHILRLASGLESMIIGEDQILGQIKDALAKSKKEGTSGIVLNTIFTKAIHVGQVARNKTTINQGSVSIGSAAVDLSEEVHGDLTNKKVLVIGAGKMGVLVAKALAEKQLKAIMVSNRTHDKAVELANELGGHAIRFNLLNITLADVDVIISATGAPHPILTKEKMSKGIPKDRRESVIIVDIANPRDVEEEVKELGIKVFDIDDLRDIADKNQKMREKSAKEVELIIDEELTLLKKSLKHLQVEPLIGDIRSEMETVRINETKKALRKLGDLSKKDKKIVNNLTKSVVDKIFYDFVNNIRSAAEEDETEVINTLKFLMQKD